MKVAFDSQIFSSQVYGGVSRYISSLASHLASQEGVDARIFAPFYINSYLSHLPADMVIGRRVGKIPVLGRFLRASNQFLGAYKVRNFRPDIVHETYYSRFTNWSKTALHVITVYDMIHELFPDEFQGSEQIIENKKVAIQRADRIICISDNTRNDLLKFHDLPVERVSVVHLGFDMLDRECTSTRQESSPEPPPYLLYVGGRAGYKNFEKFLRAYADSPWLRDNFMIVCFGGNTFQKNEHDLFHELKLSDQQIKHVAGEDTLLAKYYRHAELFVYPSLYEGFGIPLLEAMSNNCAVVCSNSSSIPEVTGNAAAFFDPEYADSICHVIETMLQSPDELSKLRRRGAERVDSFSWEKCANDTLNAYQRTLGID